MATAEKRRGFVNVDELQQQIPLETVLAYYGVEALLRQAGSEVRMACQFHCGKEKATGDRAVAVQTDACCASLFPLDKYPYCTAMPGCSRVPT